MNTGTIRPHGADQQATARFLAANLSRGPTSSAPKSFGDFAGLGYQALVPIVPPGASLSARTSIGPNARGKSPGIRGRRDGKWHGFDWITYSSGQHDYDRWQAMGAGVGIKTGQQPDGSFLVAIDADTLDKDLANLIWRDVVKTFGELPVRVGRAPKALYLLRTSEPLKYANIQFGPVGALERVELLGDGKQFVARGIHNVTGEPYQWGAPLISLDQLPVFPAELLLGFLRGLRTKLPGALAVQSEGSTAVVDQNTLRGEADRIEAAVRLIPNTSALFPSRESHRDIGYAIKAALPDDPGLALELFDDWSARWSDGENDPKYNADEFARYRPPFRRGASWLYELAALHGGAAPRVVQQYFDYDAAAAAAATGPSGPGWPEPFDLFGEADPAELSEPAANSLPDVIDRFSRTEARRKGVPRAFAAASALAVVASAIGNRLRIRPRLNDDGWTEPASLWVALIAPPGSAKSPTISAATKPLKQIDEEHYRIDKVVHDAWSLQKIKDRVGPEPKIRRRVIDDITLEKQIRLHADNPHGLLRATDELTGLLGSLGQYKSKPDADRSAMLRMFDGDPVIVDRVGDGTTRAEAALMGVLAGTQPDKICASVRGLSDDGMLQRFLFVMHDGRHERSGVDEAPDQLALSEYSSAVRCLATGAFGFVTVRLSPAAAGVLATAVQNISSLRYMPGASAAFAGHLEKWGKILPRLVLTFHALEHWSMIGTVTDTPVTAECTERAVRFARFMLRHSCAFYEEFFGETAAASDARDFAGYLLTKPDLKEFTRRTVYDAKKELRGPENARRLLALVGELETVGWCNVLERDANGPKMWTVNPAIHDRFATHAERERRERARKRELIAKAGEKRKWVNGADDAA